MHCCLRVPEIVSIVAESLDALRHVRKAPSGKGSLVAMALTCRAFYRPTRAVIWKELKGVTCVFTRCFSEDIWKNDKELTVRYRYLFLSS